MENKNEPKEEISKPKEQESKEESKKETKLTPEPPKQPEKKEATAIDEIEVEAKKRLAKVKKDEEMWVCMVDKERNFFNSADEAHFYIKKGHCKKLPEEPTPIIENAISGDNPLLREAIDEEILEEQKYLVKEELISQGKLKPEPEEEEKMVF